MKKKIISALLAAVMVFSLTACGGGSDKKSADGTYYNTYLDTDPTTMDVGLGIQPPQTSWGALASAAQQNFMFYPTQLLFPAIMIALTMLRFTLLGDGLRDALDPKLRK